MKLSHTFLIIFLLILLVACGNSIETTLQENSITSTPIFTEKPNVTSTPLPSETSTPMLFIPTVTLNPTQQIWLSTAIVVKETQQALDKQSREKEIDQFPIACEDSYVFDLSSDTKWLATSCSPNLVVQNKEGIKWVLEFEDFLHPGFPEGVEGGLRVAFWDTQSEYLYFTATVGWSGGGDFCFQGGGTLGLFRLNLKTGSWTTLIDRTDRFPGDKIRFSSTGRRYAVDINGITITDLQTGEIVQINVSRVMDLIWSPDGTKLAYSISRCDEEGFVIDGSLYIWDAVKNESRLILRTEKTLLYPYSWDDISRLRIDAEEYVPEIKNTVYTLYEYDITQDELIFIGPNYIFPY
jgi:hypothetical protein